MGKRYRSRSSRRSGRPAHDHEQAPAHRFRPPREQVSVRRDQHSNIRTRPPHEQYSSLQFRPPHSTHQSRPPHKQVSSQQNEASTSTSSVSDIPGYYFDSQRNRYFRIQSDSSNPSTSLYTESKVRVMEMKKQAEASLANIEAESLLKLMSSVSLGSCRKELFESKIKECRQTEMRLVLQQNAFEEIAHGLRPPCDSAARIFLSRIAGRSDMVGIYPESNGKISALQWFMQPRKVTREDEACFRIEGAPEPLLYCEGQVTDMCMAPYDLDNTDISAGVLWTVTGSLGRKSEAVMLRLHRAVVDDPFPSSVNFLPHAIRFDLGYSAVWSCAWNQPTTNMAFGVERKNIVLSSFIDYGQQVVFNKGQQSFGLCFSDSGRELFSGTNNGFVVCSDFRMNVNRQCSYSFQVGSPITRLQVLPERLMLVSGHDDLLATYDLRDTRLPLLSYPNHKNDYHSFSPSICVEDNVLCSVGSDCFVRVWNLATGKLLSQLRPCADVNAKNMAVTYCPQSKDNVRPTVVIVAKDNFYVYQTF